MDGAQLRAPLVAETGLARRRWWGGGGLAGRAAGRQSCCRLAGRSPPLRELLQVHRLAGGGAQLRAPCVEGRGCCLMFEPTCDPRSAGGPGANNAGGRPPQRVPLARSGGPASPLTARGCAVHTLAAQVAVAGSQL